MLVERDPMYLLVIYQTILIALVTLQMAITVLIMQVARDCRAFRRAEEALAGKRGQS